MPVTGIGGLFWRAKDPKALLEWYRQHLGVAPQGWDPWQQQAGPTMVMPFAEDSDNIPAGKAFKINFRVEGMDALLADLRAAGIAIVTKAEWDTPETGRFAQIEDPEGNAIELWEPPEE